MVTFQNQQSQASGLISFGIVALPENVVAVQARTADTALSWADQNARQAPYF